MNSSTKKWVRLDNAAKIYPAASSQKWSSIFRFSVAFKDDIDPVLLQKALERLVPRFPVFFMRLRKGLFWYYLEQSDGCPQVVPDQSFPCAPLLPKRNNGYSFRVLYYRNRIAAEFFHVIADGTGGLCFLKTLAAEYIELRYGETIEKSDGVLCCAEPPLESEMEDSFLRYAGDVSVSRSEKCAFHMSGTWDDSGFVRLTTGIMPVSAVIEKAREYKVSVNTLLVSVVIDALLHIQQAEGIGRKFSKPVKVCVPINLRNMFPSGTLRNFSSFINPGVDPRLGEYSLPDIIKAVYHYMGANASKQLLGARFTSNVMSEKSPFLRVTPLFIKDLFLKMAFVSFGDTKSSTTITNVGVVELPGQMQKYITRMDMVLGPLNINPACCAVLTYNDTLYFNITRTTREPTLEHEFFTRLVKLGIPVKIESNLPREADVKCPTA